MPLVLLGTSRPDGNTRHAVRLAFGGTSAEVVELAALRLAPYVYDAPGEDGFLALAERMAEARTLVFATPVYWYSMSGVLKTFFDRMTELVTTRKDLGRRLAGTRAFALATSATPEAPPGFEVPFARTADYLGMTWGGLCHVYFPHDGQPHPPDVEALHTFRQRVLTPPAET